ncbi:hypothetical protein F4779DRAFT_622948 [Xylariaceae sp. FL0662B]|nr:hypothetical protein F4779DRAFT_622948 [Xylariaceae sp. FL0662B]
MTKRDLLKLADALHVSLSCVDCWEGLRDKGGYENGKQFPLKLYKNGLQQRLIERFLKDTPDVNVLDGVGYNYSASYAGGEFAKFLRVRNPNEVVLRVYVKGARDEPWRILLQLMGSLIYNMITLVSEEFEAREDLSSRNFDTFMSKRSGSFDAGLKILKALPPFDLRGKRMLCIVDGLDHAETQDTVHAVAELVSVLRELLSRNHGHLLYTLSKTSKVIN